VEIIGQPELLEWFKNQYLSGEKKFFTINQICKANKECNKYGLRNQVLKLYAYGFLEIEDKYVFKRKYRIKKGIAIKKIVYQNPLSKDITVNDLRELSR